jgi:hypothetical protein
MDVGLIRLVRKRAGERREYCRLPQEFSELQFHVEHVIPRQHGGATEAANLALACPECNFIKGPNLTAVDPSTRKIVPLFNPRAQRWSAHFAFDGHRITGKTPTGRATASLLRMNEAERLRVRAILLELGRLN